MREILFRGKTKEGEWVQGDLHIAKWKYDEKQTSLIWPKNIELEEHYEFSESIEVIPETVGQYTGLTDKNGTKIFEGDVVAGALLWIDRPVNCVVAFRNGSFGVLWHRRKKEQFFQFASMYNVKYEVIGNIHDNPELMEEERE